MSEMKWIVKPEIVRKLDFETVKVRKHDDDPANCLHAMKPKCKCQRCDGALHGIYGAKKGMKALDDPNLSNAQETMIQVNSDVQDYFAEHWLKPFSED